MTMSGHHFVPFTKYYDYYTHKTRKDWQGTQQALDKHSLKVRSTNLEDKEKLVDFSIYGSQMLYGS